MSSLSKEAALVHEALVARGLETPLRPPVQEWTMKPVSV
jgi:GTP cyclohydrolase I